MSLKVGMICVIQRLLEMNEHGSLPAKLYFFEQTRTFVSLLLPAMSVGSVFMT
jgi:hypothetical protein